MKRHKMGEGVEEVGERAFIREYSVFKEQNM